MMVYVSKEKNMIDNIVFINVDDIKDAKDKYEHIHADHDAYKTIYQLKTKSKRLCSLRQC